MTKSPKLKKNNDASGKDRSDNETIDISAIKQVVDGDTGIHRQLLEGFSATASDIIRKTLLVYRHVVRLYRFEKHHFDKLSTCKIGSGSGNDKIVPS